MTEDLQAQEDELLALASIYEKNVFSTCDSGHPEGQFKARLELPTSFYIKSMETDKSGDTVECRHMVQHLPAITLHFRLPSTYPSKKAPTFTLSCNWLTKKQLSSLCKHLDQIWEENQGLEILFLWTSFLKEETLSFLDIVSPLDLTSVTTHQRGSDSVTVGGEGGDSDQSQCQDISSAGANVCHTSEPTSPGAFPIQPSCDIAFEIDARAIQEIVSEGPLYSALIEYNKSQLDTVFQMTLFTCHVCFNEKIGRQCIQFMGCDHVYCKVCMKGYFEVQIAEGNVKNLTCPDTECDSQAYPLQVKDLVDPEAYSRYDRLLLQSSLDTMSDIMYCPRQRCGAVVMIEQEDNLGTCPICRLVFCTFCKMAYHGVSPCKIKADEVRKLRELYMAGTDAERKDLERRYGRRSMQLIIEDSFSQEWLQENSKMCPSCGTHIQKIDGCNKMTCTKCRCYFCWLCSKVVPRNNPYSHFNIPGSECFNKLFQGVIVTEDDDEEEEPEFIPMRL